MASKVAQTNMDVDYVLVYRIPSTEKQAAISQFKLLIRSLTDVGLTTEVRRNDETSLLVFVKAADEAIFAEVVYRARIKDWLHGVRQLQPEKTTAESLEEHPLTDSERFRLVHHMIASPKEDGGAYITPKSGEWKNVEAMFPLHDHEKNKQWLADLTSKTFLTPQDLDNIRDRVGEKIAYYYAFMQSYFIFMIFPAAFGLGCWFLLGSYSPIYSMVNRLWCVIFVEWWKRQESELAIKWGVKHVSTIEDRRKDFKPDKTVVDSVTGEKVPYFPSQKRIQRQLLQVPLAIFSVLALGAIICLCYAIEIFISEVYGGPFKSYLVFLPTIILTLAVPTISNFLTHFADQLTHFENYETQGAHDRAMISKLFVINFITSYMAIILTSFVYVPFATILVPYLDVFHLTVKPFAENEKQMQTPDPASFTIDPNRLKNQMIYFAVTAQIVNFGMETIVPLVTQQGTKKFKEIQSSRAEKQGGTAPSISANDPPEEKEFLQRIRDEATLPEYDVTTDLREMIIQFGYLSLFSVIWPLTPLCYFINNWVEVRGDVFKLTHECRRPIPTRADSIGPWLNSLEFLAWLGSITCAALVYMFQSDSLGPDGKPHAIKLWALLLSVFVSEHVFLVVRYAVRTAIGKLDSAAQRQERSERFMVRRKFLEEAGLGEALKPVISAPNSPLRGTADEKIGSITRQSLEEDARQESLHDSTPATRFWNRQRGWAETEKVGINIIEMMESKDEKKSK